MAALAAVMAAGRQDRERELAGQEGHHQTRQKSPKAAGAREDLAHRVRWYSYFILLCHYRGVPPPRRQGGSFRGEDRKDEKDLKDQKDQRTTMVIFLSFGSLWSFRSFYSANSKIISVHILPGMSCRLAGWKGM